MLNAGREKLHGNKVEWVQAFAQEFDLNKQFDLIIMTGHAFQVLLTDEDVFATFKNISKHLKPNGLMVFESRNPAINWPEKWNYNVTIALPGGGTVEESRRFISLQNDRMNFELRYQFDDELLSSESVLRFWNLEEIQSHLTAAGLLTEKVVGDWEGNGFDKSASEEMIFFVRKQDV